jgi:hypothetical protein
MESNAVIADTLSHECAGWELVDFEGPIWSADSTPLSSFFEVRNLDVFPFSVETSFKKIHFHDLVCVRYFVYE